MKIAVIGTGRVGLVTGVTLASLGHDVHGVDANLEVVELLQEGRATFHEPRLGSMLEEQVSAGRLHFTGSVREAIPGASVAFVCVGRPATANGDGSMSAVEEAARDVAGHADGRIVVAVKSTVPPGTSERVGHVLALERPGLKFDVVSNPEFLREGHAVADALEPHRMVLGADTAHAFQVMREVYRSILSAGSILIETDQRTAELAKLACNAFLATKISFANGLARMCERTGADIRGIQEVMGADPRIGPAFLAAGLGYGGYCLPKDLDTLERISAKAGYEFRLLGEVARINDEAAAETARKIEDALWNLEGKRIALLGLAFKPDTDDVRSAPALALARCLLEGGAEVVGCDPVATTAAKNELPALEPVTDPYEAASGAHCLVVCTEWPEFGRLDPARLAAVMAYPIVVDARNLLNPEAFRDAGFVYIPMGRPA